jgi:uncharacterized protein
MTKRSDYAVGAPCWVDTWQPEPRAALRFYGPLLGWSFEEAAMPVGLEGEYFTARVAGCSVAGIAQSPSASAAAWSTHVRVDDVEQALGRAERAGGARLAGPFDVGADGRLALLADPGGVAFCVRQAARRVGAELVAAPGAWAMSSLHTADLEQAKAFYGAVFDWELDAVSAAPLAQWRLGGEVVAVAAEGTTVPPHWSVNFAVDDVDSVAEHAIALGGTVLMAPFDTPGFRNAVIADPQGGVIAVSTERPASTSSVV